MPDGFKGFISVADLYRVGCETVPRGPGVYCVTLPDGMAAQFLTQSNGGWFDGDPSVDVTMLSAKWVQDAQVLYFGRGVDLRKRVKLLVRFAHGEPVAHWGGRYLWQLANPKKLLVGWRPCADEAVVERQLLREFEREHGRLPFANLQMG